LRVLGFVQGLGLTILLIAAIWMVAAATVGVKQALSYESTSRAMGVCIIGLIISAVFQGLIFILMFSAFGASAG
jgi:hypothetical protein